MKRGFSLIEVLVVIGIIAVLMALLFPTLRAARERANGIKCASQLRQLGAGFFNYAAQNHGELPPWSGWQVAGGDGTGDDEEGLGWTEQLAPFYVKPTSPAYDCPGFPADYHINYFLTAIGLRVNHRQNWVMTQIHSSSQFILSGDCTGETLYRKPFGTRDYSTDDCDKDDAVFPALTFAGDPDGGLSVHYGGNNVLFADGHVDWARKFDATRMTFSPTDMQSWDQLNSSTAP